MMTGNFDRDDAAAAREERLDRALDRLLATQPEPEVPGDLARRILATTSRIPQEPVQEPAPVRRTRPGPARESWFQRPRAIAATLAAAAVFGFAVGWVEPMMGPEAQAPDIAAVVFGSEPEIDL